MSKSSPIAVVGVSSIFMVARKYLVFGEIFCKAKIKYEKYQKATG